MDKYVRVRRIGEGAFGKAELVKRKKDNLQLVIKEINIMRMSPKEREESRKEVSVLAQLIHPNIVSYRESFEEHGCLYIVMDFCSGGDLYAKINSQRGIMFPEDQILDWFVQMSLAIKHIHDRKILHRDIKSQNIFLTNKGGVQLGDFGIAKVLSSTAELARTCIGTPYYLSPEIVENKPYNNKSDIWSLGCVLYELATLKHAFEAGNMKNLVLKIIRGSYPPVSAKYSYELRNLIAQLFKRSPRDRPSINSILRKPLISPRVNKFLTEEQIQSEFSHTVMHGHKLGRALPPPPGPNPSARPPSAARNRGDGAGAAAAAAAKRYDPAKVYGAPIVRKSNEKRPSADVKKRPANAAGSRPGSAAGSRPGSAAGSRPGSAAGSRPGSAAGSRPGSAQSKSRNGKRPQDLQKRKLELQEKERKRRDEAKRKEYELRHKQLVEKQKAARMNKAREEGWNNLVSSLDSDSGKGGNPVQKEAQRRQHPITPAPVPRPVVNAGGDYNANANKDRGKYEHYNQYLDKLQQDRDVRVRQENVPPPAPAANYMAAPRPTPGAPQAVPVWRKAPQPTPYTPYNNRAQQQQQERAKLVEDFISRKNEAAMNKHRGHAELFGPSPSKNGPQQNQRRPPSAGPGGQGGDGDRANKQESVAASRNREEQEYLDRLRHIRQQNYQERRNLQARAQADRNPELAAEERKKKADALKKQAEDWAKQRQDVLGQKRQELFEKERRMRENRQNPGNKGPSVPSVGPAVAMTGAVNAIGANPKFVEASPAAAKAPAMTGVLGAIGATPRMVEEEDSRPKTPIQKQKEDILRKLNEKGPPKEASEAPESARSRWGAGGGEVKMAIKAETPEPERPKWEAHKIDLSRMNLEETGSQMEATSARDRVIMNPDPARRQWGGGGDTILNVLQGKPISEGTLSSQQSDDSIPSPVSTEENPSQAVGATITISKTPVRQGTITIRTAEENKSREAASANQTASSAPSTNQNESADKSPVEKKPDSPTAEKASSDIKTILEETETEVDVKDTDVKEDKVVKADAKENNSSQSEPEKPPLPPRRPTVAEKPVLLPKPVLLARPDAPREFVSGTPVAVKTQGAGTLFEKKEEDDSKPEAGSQDSQTAGTNDNQKGTDKISVRELSDEGQRRKTGLVMGMTMGTFDIGHFELLRTCSEPDLSSLFKTSNLDSCKVKVRSLDDMSTVNEEEDDDSLAAVYSSMEKATEGEEEKEEEKADDDNAAVDNDADEEEYDDDEDDDEDEEELAELMSVRATMQSLLMDDSEDDKQKSPVKFSLSSDRESRGDTNDGDVDDTEEEDVDGIGEHIDEEESNGVDEDENAGDDEKEEEGEGDKDEDDEEEGDGKEEKVNEEEGNDAADGIGMQRSISVDNENPETPDERDLTSDLFQTDDSDDEFNDGEEIGDYDLFGRLEESRAKLEEELGPEKLVKVYKTVQALQEDEDEDMAEGARIAQELLGKEKEHLYPQIFQLVMADTAFTDDSAFDLAELEETLRSTFSQ